MIKVLVGLVSSEASLLGLQMATFSLCPHMAPPVCPSTPDTSLCVLSPSSYKDSHVGLGPTHMTSFCFNQLFKGPTSKYSLILRD